MISDYGFSVESFETDFDRRIKPFALQSRLQELTYRASAEGGAGYADLRERGLFWALNRMHIVVDRWPVWGENLVLQSWFRGRTGPMYQRNYVLRRADDPDGAPLVRATSAWTVIALEGRSVSREMVYPESFAEDEDLLPFCPKVLVPAEVELAPAGSRVAAWSDLDSNGHVNNCFYPQWATDLLGFKYLSSHQLTDIQVGYYREIHPGEQLDFFLGHNPEANALDAVWYAEGRVAGERSFVVRLAFSAR
jgi:acyl-ACP thioesterase